MGWSLGWDSKWLRDIGYGVPAICDHPECNEQIDRGLSYVCGGEPYGGDEGCGLYFCHEHLFVTVDARGCVGVCEKCLHERVPFHPKQDAEEWMRFKLRDASWFRWRHENPGEVDKIRAALRKISEVKKAAPPQPSKE